MYSDRSRRSTHLFFILGAITLAIAIIGAFLTWRPLHHAAAPAPAGTSASTEQVPSWEPSTPALPDDVTVSWAYLDSTEGTMLLGGDSDPRPLGRLLVPGAAEDYLNRFGGNGPSLSPADVSLLGLALAQDPHAGDDLIAKTGGVDQLAAHIFDACQLVTAEPSPPRATAIDVAHYAACLREGALINPDRAGWVLDQMRKTAGGIGDVRGNDGGQRLAQFNSTEPAGDGIMRTACMGVGAYWSAAVFVDWPTGRGDLYGTAACAEVARAEFPPDTQQAPDASPTPAEDPST